MIEFEKMTKSLFRIPFEPSDRPDPMETSFDLLEARVQGIINELWHGREQWQSHISDLHPIWAASLRMTAMYLNMCDAFHGCGADFMREASGDESKFVEQYQDCATGTRLGRAGCLLVRTVRMLRILGFRSPLIAIGGDAFYHGSCEETAALLAKLQKAYGRQ
jgi:predicted aminopeptidase